MPAALAYVAAYLGHSKEDLEDRKLKKRLEMRLRRLFSSWEEEGLIRTAKIDGLIWIAPALRLVDLIVAREALKPFRDKPVHPMRRRARFIASKRKSLSYMDWSKLSAFLDCYKEDTGHKRLLLEHKITGQRIARPLKHRFTASSGLQKLADYEGVFEEASKRYRCGVLETLTLDPADHDNILQATRELSRHLNRLWAHMAREPSSLYAEIAREVQKLQNRILYRLRRQGRYKTRLKELRSEEDLAILIKEELEDPKILKELVLIQRLLKGDWSLLRRLIAVLKGLHPKQSEDDRYRLLARLIVFNSICRPGERPPYICVREPQDSGMPHPHIVIFGIKRLGDHFFLTLLYRRLGFGQIHHEYPIMKNRSGEWVWGSRARPRGTRTNNIKHYLKKYLSKNLGLHRRKEIDPIAGIDWDLEARGPGLDEMKGSWYFATGCRFFTHSRSLNKRPKEERDGPSQWIFIGAYYEWQLQADWWGRMHGLGPPPWVPPEPPP